MPKVRMGVIGLGYVALRSVIPAMSAHSDIDIIVFYDIDGDKCRKYAEEFNCRSSKTIDDFFENEIDVVYISTPTGTHFDLAMKAAEKGIHILCEKSMTGSYDETQKLVEFCKAKKVAILEGFMYQHHTQHAYVRDIISEGVIGDVIHLYASFGFPPLPEDNFRFNKALGGGALLDAGAYTVHFCRNFFEQEPVSIKSVIHYNDKGLDIHGNVIMDFENNRSASMVYGFNNFYQNSYIVWGTKGKLTLVRAFSLPKDFASTLTIETHGEKTELAMAPCDHFAKEIDYLINNLYNESEVNRWYDDALAQALTLSKIINNGECNED